MGKGMAVVVGCLLAMSILAVSERSTPRKWAAALPGILLAGYMVCLLWRNQVTVSAGPEGVRKENGPLPGPERLRLIPREEISRVYVRSFAVTGKYGGRFRTVGVELKDGDNLDLMVSCPPHPGMAVEAQRLANALGWRDGVTELAEQGKTKWRWAGVVPFLRLVGAVGVCAGWALAVAG